MTRTKTQMFEIMLPSVTVAMSFLLKGLTSPLKVLSIGINKLDGTIHMIVDSTGLTEVSFKNILAAPITEIFSKPGYAPISFIGKCPRTGLYIVSTTKAASNNPHIEPLGKAITSAIFNDTGKIIGAPEYDTLVTVGQEMDRVIFVTDGNSWIQVPLYYDSGQTQFAFANGVLIQGKVNTTEIYGLDLSVIKRCFANKIEEVEITISWAQIAELDHPLTYLSRDWGNGSIVVSTDTAIEGFKIEIVAGGQIMMVPEIEAIELGEAYDGIIGPTIIGTDKGITIAMVTTPDVNTGLRAVQFIPPTELTHELRVFLTGMDALTLPDAIAPA